MAIVVKAVIGQEEYGGVGIDLTAQNLEGNEKIKWLAEQFKLSSCGPSQPISGTIWWMGGSVSIVLH